MQWCVKNRIIKYFKAIQNWLYFVIDNKIKKYNNFSKSYFIIMNWIQIKRYGTQIISQTRNIIFKFIDMKTLFYKKLNNYDKKLARFDI